MTNNILSEKKRWENITWARSKSLKFDKIMGYICVKGILENSRGSKLLDLGCGDGSLLIQFEPYFSKIVGVETSKKHVTFAKIKYGAMKKIEFVHSLIEEFKPEERYDTITMVDVLEHVAKPVAMLRSIVNWVSNNGVIVVMVPNALTLTRRIANQMGILKSEYMLTKFDKEVLGHRRNYDMKLLKRHVLRAGLKIVNSGGVFLKTLSSPQMDYLLSSKLWNKYSYGWGGTDENVDWRLKYCESCYEVGKLYPNECTNIYVVASRP